MQRIDTTEPILTYENDFKKIYIKNRFYFRKKFSFLVDSISNKFHDNLDWWVSPAAERNLNSRLYHNICLYFSLKQYLKKNNIDQIVVNNFELKNKLKKFYKKQIILKKKKISFSYIKILLKHFIIFIYIKIFKKKIIPKNKINLIDKFVTSTSLKDDRYYNNFFDKKKYVYVPTFANMNILNIIKTINQMNNNKYLLAYCFLSFGDFFYSIKYIFRITKLNLNKCYFNNLEVSDFVKNELRNFDNLNASFIGIQNYLFAKKLRENKVKIEKIINWFENTNVDKGWNMGFRKFFPSSKIIGYQGFFVEKEWLHLDPSQSEFKYKVIPDKILCINQNLIKSRKEFCKKLDISYGANLRFKNFDKLKSKKKIKNSILVTLNIDAESSKNIIKTVLKTNYFKKKNKVYIKEHPLLSLDKLKLSSLPDNIKICRGNYIDTIKQFEVVITSGSSSSILQAVLMNCFIIFPFNNYFDQLNFRELKIPKSNYKICNKPEEIDKYIVSFFKKRKNFLKNNKHIKNIKNDLKRPINYNFNFI